MSKERTAEELLAEVRKVEDIVEKAEDQVSAARKTLSVLKEEWCWKKFGIKVGTVVEVRGARRDGPNDEAIVAGIVHVEVFDDGEFWKPSPTIRIRRFKKDGALSARREIRPYIRVLRQSENAS